MAKGSVESSGSVQLVAKVAQLLEALAERPEASVAELAEVVDEPRSSLYRLLRSLRDVGYVEPGSRRGTFRLGLKLLELGSAVADHFDVRRSALPVMERLHEETGETVYVCVRRDDAAVCIERLEGRRVQSLALRVGGSQPLHAGAASRALLAFEDRADWDGYWRRNAAPRLPALTDRTPVTKGALFAALERAVAEGMAVSDQDVTVGIAALGVPIFDRSGTPCAALSISGVREEILNAETDALGTRLREGAAEISAAMGFRTTPVQAG
ncbi:MAG: putative transcriptional regulator, IclR family protein [Conexibacter sp.]|nr:putative transcriptional regulator, IclR family protein [Conexibacter sp.]